jgi:hypothetical protein
MIMTASAYSLELKRVYARDTTENSDEKNQNSSIVANGRLTPRSKNINSKNISKFRKLCLISFLFCILFNESL